METICIYIEKYYFEERVFPYIEKFLRDLNEIFILYIFIPDIYVIKNIIKNPNIKSYLRKLNFRIESELINTKFDGLIIFSDYDRGMYFDRRELIVKSLNFIKVFTINTNYFDKIVPIKNFKSIMLLNEINFMSYNDLVVENIFMTYKLESIEDKNNFIEKYKLDKTKKILGIVVDKDFDKNIDLLLKEYISNYNILSNVSINNVIKVSNLDFINIMSFSEKFICDKKNLDFLYNTSKREINLISDKFLKRIEIKRINNELPSVTYCVKSILQTKNDLKNNFYIIKKNGN